MSNFQRYEPQHEDINRPATPQELVEAPRMTRKECSEIMRSNDYKRSRLAQELIRASIAKGYLDEAPTEQEEQASGDMIAARHAHVKKLFSDPRYRTDAEYRHEVAQKVAALTANDHETLSPDALSRPNQVVRVSLSKAADRGSDLTVNKYQRFDLPMAEPQPNAPAKPAREPFSD